MPIYVSGSGGVIVYSDRLPVMDCPSDPHAKAPRKNTNHLSYGMNRYLTRAEEPNNYAPPLRPSGVNYPGDHLMATDISCSPDDPTDVNGHFVAVFDVNMLRQPQDLHAGRFNVLMVDSHVSPMPYKAVAIGAWTSWYYATKALPWNTLMVQNPVPALR